MPKGQPQRLPSIDESSDPMVREMLSEVGRKDEEAKLTPKERKLLTSMRKKEAERKAKAAQKTANQAKNRQHLLLPVNLKTDLDEIAKWHKTTVSQVVTFLLYEAVKAYQSGQINFTEYKNQSYNPRYDFELIHPNDDERQARRSAQKKKKGWG